ncbi:uncharacterized protein FIBRA_07755 [Fibroporia radiculosa]|uniref:Protein kinase domain-containing protein n=1 Tax=Fibroporia radiculosa TaxID=599839 RepID=J4H4T1_9APHY|nr:uncharacterized protein FIBRA_07755 [Fibroporia radiculosa]CCM05529.1 predicted protein [Fibroporia radiculosa]
MVQFSAILPDFKGLIITLEHMRLRLIKRLGSGAYGVVYLAYDNSLPSKPTPYAVKCLLKHPKESDYHHLQQREIAYHKAASAHPCVVKLHGVIEEEHYLYLILDYCPGGDLFSAIIDHGMYVNDDVRVKRSFLQLLDAIHGCHDLGISHRDLKPENILLSGDGSRVYLTDFGLATKAKLSASFGCGSSFYMSPECAGADVSKRPFVTSISDIWALGVILVNMITGRNPWHIASTQDTGYASYLVEGKPYLQRMLHISRGAVDLLSRIFVDNPAERITIHQLRAAVIEIDTFFPTAPNLCPPVKTLLSSSRPVGSVDITDCLRVGTGASDAAEVKIVDIRPISSPDDNDKITVPKNIGTPPKAFTPVGDESLFVNASDSLFTDDSGSDSESSGPVTPQTRAVAIPSPNISSLLLEFPEVPPDIAVRLSERNSAARRAQDASLTMKKRKLPRSWERFVQRIKVRV